MALLASRREMRAHVVWYAPAKRLGALKILRMAWIARRRQPLELSCRGALMAVIALQRCMRAQQREAVEVILNCLHGYVPPVHRMALFAVRAHLPPMNVGVTIRAS